MPFSHLAVSKLVYILKDKRNEKPGKTRSRNDAIVWWLILHYNLFLFVWRDATYTCTEQKNKLSDIR